MSLIVAFCQRPRVIAVFVLSLLFIVVLPVSGQSTPLVYDELTKHLTAIEVERLTDEGQIISVDFEFQSDSPLVLVPLPIAERIAQFSAEGAAGLSVEALFFTRLTDAERAAITPRAIYNITRSISTLAGIEYYSASRKRYRIFYKDSYVIDNPKSKIHQPDPLIAAGVLIPDSDMQYLRQRDSSFGDNVYRASYIYQDDITTLEITNLTTMFYTIIPLVQPEQLRTLFAAILTEEGAIFYGVSLVELGAGGVFGLEERAANSFTNRIIAVSDWFADQLTGNARGSGE